MALLTVNSLLSSSVEGVSSTTTANSNSILPEDVIFEVLSRLPVKALIRFKSSCRSWYDLISNPSFISTHLKNNSTNKVRCQDDDDNFCGLKVVAFNVVDDPHPNSVYDYLQLNLNVDFDMKETPIDVVGYCDGMFCLSTRPVTNRHGDRKPPTTIFLHNPALRETRVLPPSHSNYPEDQWICRYSVGFGFDQKTKDYIVVKMFCLLKSNEDAVANVDETDTVLEVYSPSTDSWRVAADNVVRDLDPNASSTMVVRDFANGIPCGSLDKTTFGEDEVVVPFHIDDEMFRMRLRLPTSHYTFDLRPFTSLHLAVVNGKLAFVRSYIERKVVDGHTWVEIWVMTTNSCDVEKPGSLVYTLESLPAPIPWVGFWNTNVLLMYDYRSRCPILYDLVTKQSTDLQLCGELDFFYKESLFSVKRRTVQASEVTVQV